MWTSNWCLKLFHRTTRVSVLGCFMILAWMLFASLGMIVSRNFREGFGAREIFGVKIWFQVCYLHVTGFAFILFIYWCFVSFVFTSASSIFFLLFDERKRRFKGMTVLQTSNFKEIVIQQIACWITFNTFQRAVNMRALSGSFLELLSDSVLYSLLVILKRYTIFSNNNLFIYLFD